MKIENLREFIVFSEYLSFTAAAKKLYMTQPALSYRIAHMEKELGFCLVERGGSLRITPAGKAFLDEAQEIVARYESMLVRCRDLTRRQTERLVVEQPIGMPGCSALVTELVSLFVREAPDVDVRFSASHGRHFYDVLADGVADIGIAFGEVGLNSLCDGHPGFSAVALPPCEDARLYALLPAGHVLVEKDTLFACDLDGCTLAFQSDPQFRVGREFFERVFERRGVDVRFHGKSERDNIEFLWDVTEHEILLSDSGLRTMGENGSLCADGRVLRPLDDADLSVCAYLVYRVSNTNPALRRFLDWVACGKE